MTIDQKAGLLGLVTNASRLAAPRGSLEVADNVVVRKQGVVEPRPGVSTISYAPTGAGASNKIWDYASRVFAMDTSGSVVRQDDASTIDVTAADGTSAYPVMFREDLVPVSLARGNCYMGMRQGVRKLKSGTDATFSESGAPFIVSGLLALSSAGSPAALATGYKVAYRFVLARKTDNIITRSISSGAITISNTSGGTRDVTVYVAYPEDFSGTIAQASSTDTVEIYRTRAFTTASTIDEEFALVGSLQASLGLSLLDNLTDAQRGAALYTSPSQGGATSENQRPPAAGCMELFKGSLFFGNVVGPFRKKFSVNVTTTDLTGVVAGVGYRSIASCDTAVGSPLVTSMANTTGLEAGMIISFPGTGFNHSFPQNTYIVSVDSSTQVTMSANATQLNVNVTCYFVDAIKLGGQWKPVFPSMDDLVFSNMEPFVAGVSGMVEPTWYATIFYNNLAAASSKTYFVRSITPTEPRYTGTYVAEEIVRSSQTASTQTMQATHGSSYSVNMSSAINMDRDVLKNGIYWSKTDEPEHVPPLSYALVGDGASSIVGMASTKDSLFILKEDGIWRLSGSAGSWRIDPFDLTTFCVLPQSIQKLNGGIYFLSNKGVVRLSESGAEVISGAIGDEVRKVSATALTNYASSGYYHLGYQSASYSAVDELNSEYMLSIASSGVTLSNVLVYNESTSAWTTWSFPTSGAYSIGTGYPKAMAWSKVERSVCIGNGSVAPYLRKLTVSGTDSPLIAGYDARSDGYTSVTISSVTGSANSYTVTYTGAALLRVNDVVVSNSRVYVVTSVTSSIIVVVSQRVNLSEYEAPVTGAAFVAASITSTVRSRPFVSPSTVQKLWSCIKAGFAELKGAASTVITSLSNASGAQSNSTAQVTELVSVPYYRGRAASYRGNDFKMNVPRDHARARDLWPGVVVVGAMGNWQLDNFSADSLAGEPNKPPYTQTGAA